MTDDMMNLSALVEKAPGRICCEMIDFAAKRLMEMEVCAATGATWGEKSPLRSVNQATSLAAPPSHCANRGSFPLGRAKISMT